MAEKMNLSAEAIFDKEFHVDFKGYSPSDVDGYLDLIIQDYQRYEELLSQSASRAAQADSTIASLKARIIELEGRQKLLEDVKPESVNQVDILKRLAKLEQEVYRNKVSL